MAQNNSRLQETNFSQFNLREAYITDQAEYLAALRDEALFSNWGLQVLIRVPIDEFGEINENNVDEYSNFVDVDWKETTETVVPKFTEYRQNVSEDGMAADGTTEVYPLEVIIPTKLHLPRNSRIIFTEYNSREEKIAREWVVLGTQMKQLSNSKTYSRVANCVPARKDTYEVTTVSSQENIIYFDATISALEKETLSGQGTIWFSRRSVPDGYVTKINTDPDLPTPEEGTKNKKITPYQLDAVFAVKKLAISVLN